MTSRHPVLGYQKCSHVLELTRSPIICRWNKVDARISPRRQLVSSPATSLLLHFKHMRVRACFSVWKPPPSSTSRRGALSLDIVRFNSEMRFSRNTGGNPVQLLAGCLPESHMGSQPGDLCWRAYNKSCTLLYAPWGRWGWGLTTRTSSTIFPISMPRRVMQSGAVKLRASSLLNVLSSALILRLPGLRSFLKLPVISADRPHPLRTSTVLLLFTQCSRTHGLTSASNRYT